MNDLEQAARQALEALENRFNPKGFGEMDKAIDALRQALEQKPCDMGQMCLDCQPRGANGECPDQRPKQEPVAWISKQSLAEIEDFDATVYGRGGFDDATPLYTEPPQREPLTDAQIYAVAADIWGSALIAPQSCQLFARAIEAKLREKNT